MSNNLQIVSWRLENRNNQIKEVSVKNKVVVYDFAILRELIINNSGIGMLPNYLLTDKSHFSRVQMLLPSWSSPNIELHAIYPGRRGMTSKLRVFLDFISEKFRADDLFSHN